MSGNCIAESCEYTVWVLLSLKVALLPLLIGSASFKVRWIIVSLAIICLNIILTPVVFGLEVVSSVEMLGRLVDMFVRLVDKSDVTLSNEVLITVWIKRVELSF